MSSSGRGGMGGGYSSYGRGGGTVVKKVPLGVVSQMMGIFGTMIAVLLGILYMQTPSKEEGRFWADPKTQPSKYHYEKYVYQYTPFWMFWFGLILVYQTYEDFDGHSYNMVCGGFAIPLVMQPLFFPQGPDEKRKWYERYSFKANVWIGIYSFIGNYYFTHYFYSVLKAEYTYPSIRLNGVPVAMIYASHLCFSTYHACSNAILRKIETSFVKNTNRNILVAVVIVLTAYLTAFMENLIGSSFPYYKVRDWEEACIVGSAFYGLYFCVSFPAFYYFDPNIDHKPKDGEAKKKAKTIWETIVHVCGYAMMTLLLLDFARLYMGVPFKMEIDKSKYYY